MGEKEGKALGLEKVALLTTTTPLTHYQLFSGGEKAGEEKTEEVNSETLPSTNIYIICTYSQ